MLEIDEAKAQQLLQSFFIPAKPQLLVDLYAEAAQLEPDLPAIARVISQDVSLSANVLKVINSPAFGLGHTVVDIKQSVMMLGLQNILSIVTFHELRENLSGEASISLERFWDTAAEMAQLMVMVVRKLNLKWPPEDAYIIGLFHDCGIPVMAMKFADYKETLMLANDTPDRVITAIEEERYQSSHTVVGYFVATSWHLPAPVCEIILRHHEPDLLKQERTDAFLRDMYGVHKIAANVLNRLKRLDEDNDWTRVHEDVLYHFGVSEHDYADIEADLMEELQVLVV